MTFRFAEDKDRDAIEEILDLSFSSGYAHYAKKSFASLENSLVAEEDNKVTGVINWEIYHVNGDKIGYIFWIAVHPGYRRKGTGEGLILRSVKCMEEEIGPSDIYSAVDKHNLPMRNLFEKMGFSPDGRQVIEKKYGLRRLKIYSDMMLMPWEDLFVKFKL